MQIEDSSRRIHLISVLLLEAGGLMEDFSPELALMLPDTPEGVSVRIARLATVADDLAVLAAAARVLLR